MSTRTKAEAFLVVVTAIWGCTFVVVKGALADASPLPFLAVRFILAGLLLLAILGRGQVDRETILPGFILGLFLFGGYLSSDLGLAIYYALEKRVPHWFQRDPGAGDHDALRL